MRRICISIELYFLKIKKIFKDKLSQNILFLILGSGLSQGLVLISNIFVARILGIQDYGKLGIIQSTLALFAILSGTTFGLTPQKYVAELIEIDKERTARIIKMSVFFISLFSIILSLLLFVLSSKIATVFFNDSSMSVSLKCSALALFFNSMFGAQSGILAGFQEFKTISFLNLVKGVSSFPAMLLGGYLFGLNGVILGTGIAAFGTYFLTEYKISDVKQKLFLPKVKLSSIYQEGKLLLTYTLPSIVGAVVSMPVIWYSNTLLINSSKGYKEMAVFNMANTWRLLVLFIPTIMSQPFMSTFASYFGFKDFSNLRKYIRLNVLIVTVITLIPVLLIATVSKLIVSLYGVEFKGTEYILIILCLSGVLSSISSVLGNIFYISNHVWFGVGLNSLWALLFIGIFYCFSDKNSLNLTYAYILSYAAHLVGSWVLSRNLLLNIQKKHDFNN